MDAQKLVWVYASLFVSAVFGGAGFVFMKDSLAVFSASGFTFWRFFLSAAILFPFFAKKACDYRVLRDGFIAGAMFCVATLVQLQGIAHADVGRSAFINSSSIVLVPMFQTVLTRKAPSAKTLAGCFVCLCGVAFLSMQKMTGHSDGMAEALVFAGTCLFACQLVVFKLLVQRHDPAVLSFVEFAAIALTALPVAVFSSAPLLPFEGSRGWGGVFYAALVLNIVMIIASNNALRYIPPTNVTVINSTQAIHGALFGVLLLHETVTRQFVVSGSVIIAGILIVIAASAPKLK